ncbi:MAG: hypothetical protein JW999_00745, partial [Methanotrichaceae archaeon]|nr:hypothetical protein [Methanotrichaceae archaeon]
GTQFRDQIHKHLAMRGIKLRSGIRGIFGKSGRLRFDTVAANPWMTKSLAKGKSDDCDPKSIVSFCLTVRSIDQNPFRSPFFANGQIPCLID